MSALVVAVGTDGILIASDGVCYTYETGDVSGFVSKVILLPEYDCFIGSTGAGAFGVALRGQINQQIASFDEFVDRFAEFFETVHRGLFTNARGHWDRGPMSEVSCVIGGWSDARQAYEAWRMVSYEKPSVDMSDGRSLRLEPFTALQLPAAMWCNISPSTMEEFGLKPPLENEETIDVASRLVCAARADSGWTEAKEEDGDSRYFMAGGFIQISVIQRNYSQSWIAYRWEEDRIGKPIDPDGPERFPTYLKERYEKAKSALASESLMASS